MIRQADEQRRQQIAERLRDIRGIQAAVRKAVRQAIQEHARAGRKIAVWRDGQVVWETPSVEEPKKEETLTDNRDQAWSLYGGKVQRVAERLHLKADE